MYEGKERTLVEIARLNNCHVKCVYRYYGRNHTIEGFASRHERYPKRIPFKGKLLTIKEVADVLGAKEDTVRSHYHTYLTMEGFGEKPIRKGMVLPHLEPFYHTLNDNIPLDRCIKSAGYRSINHFCKANGISASLLCCWRKGKIYDERGIKYRYPNATLVDEMTNGGKGISLTLYKVMVGTGFLEYELFPDVFTEAFYKNAYGHKDVDEEGGSFRAESLIESRETRRIIKSILDKLPDRGKEVIELYFGLKGSSYGRDCTYDNIAKRLGITREAVRQSLNRSLRLLRHPCRMMCLKDLCPWIST